MTDQPLPQPVAEQRFEDACTCSWLGYGTPAHARTGLCFPPGYVPESSLRQAVAERDRISRERDGVREELARQAAECEDLRAENAQLRARLRAHSPNDLLTEEHTTMIKPITARKKPIEVQAIQWTGHNPVHVQCLTGDAFAVLDPEDRANCDDPEATAQVFDKLHSTWVLVYTGDWIIEGIQGEFYPCRASVFAETYEQVPA